MPIINMLSAADSIKGQGVGSCYEEQVKLVNTGLKDKFEVKINSKKNTDIMHFHTINFSFFLRISSAKKHGCAIGYVHFVPSTIDGSIKIPRVFRSIFYNYIIKFYNKMDYLVTVNPNFISILEEYNIDKSKVVYIPNFVSNEDFYSIKKEDLGEFYEKYNIPKDKFVVISAGQIQTRKGVKDFIEVAKKLPHVQFLWVGGFSFGGMTDGYKELKVIMENPPSNVIFTGIVDRSEMNSLYNMADLLFLPSYSELFPMTILEAMSTSLPLLLRDIDVYPNILFDYYAKSDSVDGFVKCITELMENKNLYEFYKSKSKEGSNFYSKENVLKFWDNFYTKAYNECCMERQKNKKYF